MDTFGVVYYDTHVECITLKQSVFDEMVMCVPLSLKGFCIEHLGFLWNPVRTSHTQYLTLRIISALLDALFREPLSGF